MGFNSNIEWCDHTFNPWIGCTKISPACDNCYAEAMMDKRFKRVSWGAKQPRKRTSKRSWREPLKWDRAAAENGLRYRVFCASLADVFDNSVPADWQEDLWQLIRETPNLDWLLLTKRPQNIAKMLPDDWGHGYANVWLGTTVENQKEAERRIPVLCEIPCRLRFLSCEPLLSTLNLEPIGNALFDRSKAIREAMRGPALLSKDQADAEIAHPQIHWVIAGGESGQDSRSSHPSWFTSLRDQCRAAQVPFFFKQWGDWVPGEFTDHGEWAMNKVGKHRASKLLDGCLHQEFPVLEQGYGATQ